MIWPCTFPLHIQMNPQVKVLLSSLTGTNCQEQDVTVITKTSVQMTAITTGLFGHASFHCTFKCINPHVKVGVF